MNPPAPETEIAALNQEVARLRKEMNELRRFIRYQPPGMDDDGKPEDAYLDIQCTFLTLVHPGDPSRARARLFADQEGAWLALMDKEEKTRLLLTVEKDETEFRLNGAGGKCKASLRLDKDEPQLNLFGPEDKIGVQIRVEAAEGRGVVGVCEGGKPRAVMKATEIGSAISVVHDGGLTRMTMIGTETNGELIGITQDMKAGVKISADGQNGGYITVNNAVGKAGVILSNIDMCGAVIVNDKAGNLIASLPSVPE
jgi:hypothetical protein